MASTPSPGWWLFWWTLVSSLPEGTTTGSRGLLWVWCRDWYISWLFSINSVRELFVVALTYTFTHEHSLGVVCRNLLWPWPSIWKLGSRSKHTLYPIALFGWNTGICQIMPLEVNINWGQRYNFWLWSRYVVQSQCTHWLVPSKFESDLSKGRKIYFSDWWTN